MSSQQAGTDPQTAQEWPLTCLKSLAPWSPLSHALVSPDNPYTVPSHFLHCSVTVSTRYGSTLAAAHSLYMDIFQLSGRRNVRLIGEAQLPEMET